MNEFNQSTNQKQTNKKTLYKNDTLSIGTENCIGIIGDKTNDSQLGLVRMKW